MSATHLSDDELLEMCLDLIDSTPAHVYQAHLGSCEACAARHVALAGLLTDASDAASVAAAEAFSPEWLTRQRARILHRVSSDGQPARVLAFPGQTSPSPVFARRSQATRWVAAGVAAGLAIGLVTGHLVSRPRTGTPARVATQDTTLTTNVRPIVASMSDDEFLGQIEVAVARGGPESLRPLDALTPRAWDVR